MSETINSYTSSELLHGFRIQPQRTKTFHQMMCDARHSESPNRASIRERPRQHLLSFVVKPIGGLLPMGGKKSKYQNIEGQVHVLCSGKGGVQFSSRVHFYKISSFLLKTYNSRCFVYQTVQRFNMLTLLLVMYNGININACTKGFIFFL